MSSDLKRDSRRAVVWDIFGTLSTQGVSFGVSIVLSWLLDPAEFGIVGMAMAFIAISHSFIDAGFASALIQSQEATDDTFSSVFLINIGLAVALLAAFYAGAPYIADFYGEPELRPVVRWLAIGMVITALGIVQDTLLQKALRFKELTLRRIVAGLSSAVVGVGMAYAGYGVYALVGQHLTLAAVSTIMLWSVSGWTPNWRYDSGEVRKIWGFGSYVFLSGMLANIITRIDILMIGKVFSAATLGFYARAESLNNLVGRYTSNTLKKVFFPVLSKIQGDPVQFERVYLKVLALASVLVFFLAGGLVLAGDFLILTVFGEKWAPSAVIFQILMLKIFTYPISSIVLNAMLSTGRAKELFWSNNVTRVLRIGGWAVAFYYGFYPYLWTVVIINIIATIYYSGVVDRTVGVSLWKQTKAIYAFALVFVAAMAVAWPLKQVVEHALTGVIVSGLAFAVVYVLITYLTHPTLSRLAQHEVLQLAGGLRRRANRK